MITGRAKLAGVIGDPIGHSLSPVLHGYWLDKYGIDGAYVPLNVAAQHIGDVLQTLPLLHFKGVNLTLPHKEAALHIVDELSDIAQRIGAVNTVTVKQNGLLYGTNSDAEGFIQNLRQQAGDPDAYLDHAMILGAGGAARAIAVALLDAGVRRLSLSNRSAAKAQALASALDTHATIVDWQYKDEALADVSLLVNTTSLGMTGQPALELSLDALPQTALVSDVIYNPLMTPLLKQAKARGHVVVTGLGMLIHQAVAGFESWYGFRPETDAKLVALLEGMVMS